MIDAEVVAGVHAFATIAMTGLCWFVQVVHYPLFAAVGHDQFVTWQRGHVRRTGQVVAPLMLAEVVSASALLFFTDGSPARGHVWWGLLLLALVWVSTFALQVPAHRVLERGFDARAHRRLVRSNWLRTLAWSARSVLAILILLAIRPPHS